MKEQHSITPPPELVEEWLGLWPQDSLLAAAQWGADQELEACCEWLKAKHWIEPEFPDELRAARRPKPPSLKEQALDLLNKAEDPSWDINDFTIVRRALEQLPDNE
jgi:hypothetical protein